MKTDWVAAFENARATVAELGLAEVLALPPERLVEGLQTWRSARR